MTEQEWLTSADPGPMLTLLDGRASERKLRLFSAACRRHIWHLYCDERSRHCVEVIERFADGNATEEERRAAKTDAEAACHDRWYAYKGVGWNSDRISAEAATEDSSDLPYVIRIAGGCALAAAGGLHRTGDKIARKNEQTWQAGILRDIFRNPFRLVAPDRSCFTCTVTSLAAGIYEERQLPSGLFDNQRMGILADALEDAGCENTDILGHLRAGGDHVRGCHVIDFVLGKS